MGGRQIAGLHVHHSDLSERQHNAGHGDRCEGEDLPVAAERTQGEEQAIVDVQTIGASAIIHSDEEVPRSDSNSVRRLWISSELVMAPWHFFSNE